MLTLRRLLWLDGCSAALAGLAVLPLAAFGPLPGMHGLPMETLLGIGLAALLYAAYGLTLATRRRPPVRAVQGLALANAAWAAVCLSLLAAHWHSASLVGALHLALEAGYVIMLAALEWRAVSALAPSRQARQGRPAVPLGPRPED